MKLRGFVIASILCLSGVLVPEVGAYQHYLTDGDAAACEAGRQSRCPQPLRWWRRATHFTLGTVAPKELPAHEVRGLVEEAFAQWLSVECAAQGFDEAVIPRVSYGGESAARRATRPLTAKGEPDNLIVFVTSQEEWCGAAAVPCPGNSPTWIAITKIAHHQITGEIVDADIEINNADFAFSTDGTPGTGEVDFMSMLVHEVGHFFGLDHSEDRDASMFALYSKSGGAATAARTLEADDREGICSLYTDVPARGSAGGEGCQGGPAGLGGLGLFALGLLRRR